MSSELEARIERLLERAGKKAAPTDSASTDQPSPPTPTSTTATPPNDVPVPQPTQQEQAQTDSTQPTVRYYAFQPDASSQPVGMFRQVFDAQDGLTLHKVDQNGKWVEDNSLLNDIGPLDPNNEDSRWSWTDEVPEQEAKQIYEQHFASGSQKPETPPTQTTQSQPASGVAAPPTNITAPGKSVADDDPFYEGLDVKGRVEVKPYVREGHVVAGYVQERRIVHLPDLGPIEDDVSIPGQPPISDHALGIIKQYGLERDFGEYPKSPRTSKLLGGAPDTQTLYQVDGEYTPARAALHKKLLDDLFAGHKPQPEGKRVALFTAGGTAVGKSSALRADPNLQPPDAVVINPDDFKTMLPEWHDLTKIPPAIDAASAVHEESSDLAKAALKRAIDEGYNLVLDGTGDSGPGKFLSKIQAVHDAGYQTDVLMVDVPTNTAIDRMIKRGDTEHRYVPIPEMIRLHHGSIERMQEWSQSPMVARFNVYRTNTAEPTLVASGGGGRTQVHDEAQWKEILAKPSELAKPKPAKIEAGQRYRIQGGPHAGGVAETTGRRTPGGLHVVRFPNGAEQGVHEGTVQQMLRDHPA